MPVTIMAVKIRIKPKEVAKANSGVALREMCWVGNSTFTKRALALTINPRNSQKANQCAMPKFIRGKVISRVSQLAAILQKIKGDFSNAPTTSSSRVSATRRFFKVSKCFSHVLNIRPKAVRIKRIKLRAPSIPVVAAKSNKLSCDCGNRTFQSKLLLKSTGRYLEKSNIKVPGPVPKRKFLALAVTVSKDIWNDVPLDKEISAGSSAVRKRGTFKNIKIKAMTNMANATDIQTVRIF